MARVGILSDIHFPFHDPKAWKLTLKVLPTLNLDGLMLLGDVIDFEPISRFVSHPRRRLDLQPHLHETWSHLLHLRDTLPNQKMWYKAGNHELRMETYLYTKAPELADLEALTVPELLGLKRDLNIQWVPWEQEFALGKLHVTHGDEYQVGSAFPARATYMKVATNMIVGHHHRRDSYLHRHYGSDLHGVWVNPCLSLLSAGRWAKFPQWHQGMSVVETTKSGFFDVSSKVYWRVKGTLHVLFGGKLYTV